LLRQLPYQLQERLPQTGAQGDAFGQQVAAGQLLTGQGGRQLPQRQGVAAGLLDQPVTNLGGDLTGAGLQQLAG
jgi:hypothetical protein